MKPDERLLLADMLAFCLNPYMDYAGGPSRIRLGEAEPEGRTTPRILVEGRWRSLGIHAKRAYYLLGKWADRDWYDYGVCLDLGWITPEGWDAVRALGIEPSSEK